MLLRIYYQLASPRRALTFTVLAVFLFWRLASGLGNLPPNAPTIFDLQLAFTPGKFQAVLDAWGESNVAGYVNVMWLDYLYPIAYALALSGWIAVLTRRREQPPPSIALVLFAAPLLAALLDYLENTLHLLILTILRATPPALVFTASLAAAIKWGLAVLSILAILVLTLRRAFGNRASAD